MDLLAVLLTLTVLCLGLAALWVHHLVTRRKLVHERVQHGEQSDRASDRLPAWLLKMAQGAVESGERYTPKGQRAKIERWLMYAGHPYGLDLPTFLGLRFVVIFIALVPGAPLTFIIGYRVLLIAMLVGYWAPIWWLKNRADARQDEIATRLPDFLDTLAVSLRAGTGFYPTLRKVAHRFGGALGAEFTLVVQRIEMGEPISGALRSIRQRTTCRELDLCVESITQGLDLGVPIAATLSAQANALRTGRIQRAKEKAAKASPKITMLTTMLVTPGVFLLLIGMVLLNIYYNPERYGIQFLLE